MTKREFCRILGIVLILFVFLHASGCDNTFEPLQENDQYAFTMAGTLDLHADTQWVRVMPVGESLIPTDPKPKGTEVTLTRNRTGETIVMNDSLFRFGDNAYVWNYQTTRGLQPNEEYTVIATAPDGGQSDVTVTIPSVLPVPEVDYSEESEEGFITGTSADPLVTVDTRYLVQAITERGCTAETEIVFSHLDDLFTDPDGEYHLNVDNMERIARELGSWNYRVNRRELVIFSARKDWPDLSGLMEEEIVLPDVVSNVENGTGLVAGVAGRRVVITPRRKPCFRTKNLKMNNKEPYDG